MTENKPALRDIWVPELVILLNGQYPNENIDEGIIRYALSAGDALSKGNDEPHTSKQRQSYRKRFPM